MVVLIFKTINTFDKNFYPSPPKIKKKDFKRYKNNQKYNLSYRRIYQTNTQCKFIIYSIQLPYRMLNKKDNVIIN